MVAFIQIIILVAGIGIITLSTNLPVVIFGALVCLAGIFFQVLIMLIGKRQSGSNKPEIQINSNIDYYLRKGGMVYLSGSVFFFWILFLIFIRFVAIEGNLPSLDAIAKIPNMPNTIIGYLLAALVFSPLIGFIFRTIYNHSFVRMKLSLLHISRLDRVYGPLKALDDEYKLIKKLQERKITDRHLINTSTFNPKRPPSWLFGSEAYLSNNKYLEKFVPDADNNFRLFNDLWNHYIDENVSDKEVRYVNYLEDLYVFLETTRYAILSAWFLYALYEIVRVITRNNFSIVQLSASLLISFLLSFVVFSILSHSQAGPGQEAVIQKVRIIKEVAIQDQDINLRKK